MASGSERTSDQVIIVSDRLPYELSSENKEENGTKLIKSVSGLFTLLDTLQENAIWIGAVIEEDEPDFQRLLVEDKDKYKTVPIPREMYEHYRKWCNRKIWPIFHGMQNKVDNTIENDDCWKGYTDVNKVFVKAIIVQLESRRGASTILWFQDYQHFLVPTLIRQFTEKRKLCCRIGSFLHIPFPPLETFQKLPNFRAILEGMLGSDAIAFHTKEYCKNFLDCFKKYIDCTATTEINSSTVELLYQGRKILVQAISGGIDYETFSEYSKGHLSEKYPKELRDLNLFATDKKFLIGVERLDYTKGLLQKVQAFKLLLKKYPELDGKILYLQIAVPCRTNEPQYKNLRQGYEQSIQETNEYLENKDYQSRIQVIFKKVSQQDLSILYRRADVALVTPLIDGLNLVALEYIACQPANDPGVLVLSKNTGAAKYLPQALQVDPNNVEMADAMHRAITMTKTERQHMMKELQKQVKERLTTKQWVDLNLEALRGNGEE